MTTPEEPKQPRKRRGANDFGSKTKPKGTPVVGKQAETLFGSVRGNPAGCTKEAALNRHRNAEIAARSSNKILTAFETLIDDAISKGVAREVVDALSTNMLNLMRDAMDREYGKAVGSMDITSNGETVGPQTIRLIAATKEDDGSAD